MKKISVLIILALLLSGFAAQSCNASILANHRIKVEQNKIRKSILSDIRGLIEKQDFLANEQKLNQLKELYSPEFVNSDGFGRDVYFQMIEDTWKTYPDIYYQTEVKNIDYSDNYATVLVEEIAVAAPRERIGSVEAVGELYSVSKCVYHLEKQGLFWKIISEKIIEEKTILRFGEARYIPVELDAPKQIGAGKSYTATLKINPPEGATVVASINREKTIYPQVKSEDAFRKVYDGVLERVFQANTDNINEYAVASVGITHAENYDEKYIRVYMNGMAFLMTRINVVPENKFIDIEVKDEKHE